LEPEGKRVILSSFTSVMGIAFLKAAAEEEDDEVSLRNLI
jgi:hypothetical protein